MNLDLTEHNFGAECIKDKQGIFDDLRDYIKAEFLDDNALFVVGDTIPSIEDQDKIWIRVDSIGWPIDILTYTASGWKGLSHREVGNVYIWASPQLPSPQTEWAWCDGRQLSITEYADLYAVFGTKFNDGTESAGHFRIPFISSRNPIGTGAGGGLTARTINDKGGEEAHVLLLGEIASHDHTVGTWMMDNDAPDTCGIPTPIGGFCGATSLTLTSGSDSPHNNMQPFTSLNYITRIKAL